MLPQPHRLPTPDIKQVMRSGRRITSPQLTLIYQGNTVGTARFAIVVSKNIDKRATARNRVKRLIREALRSLLPSIPQGFDSVIIVRRKLTSLQETKESIKGLVLSIKEEKL